MYQVNWTLDCMNVELRLLVTFALKLAELIELRGRRISPASVVCWRKSSTEVLMLGFNAAHKIAMLLVLRIKVVLVRRGHNLDWNTNFI